MYPWDKLDEGDHFVFPEGTKKATAAGLAYRAGKVNDRAFAIRVEGDLIKCWRVEKAEPANGRKAKAK